MTLSMFSRCGSDFSPTMEMLPIVAQEQQGDIYTVGAHRVGSYGVNKRFLKTRFLASFYDSLTLSLTRLNIIPIWAINTAS